MTKSITGACACGTLTYEITDKPRLIVNCHCNACRKRNGSAFSTYLAAAESGLHITQGEDSLKKYIVADEGEKYFCDVCGSPLFNKNYAYPDLLMVFYGSVDDNAKLKPLFNVFCESQHDWVNAVAKLKSFAQRMQK